MILIADSGSTKTLWLCCQSANNFTSVQTSGINPYLIGEKEIEGIIQAELYPQIDVCRISHIFFYGAGCSVGSKSDIVKNCLQKSFTSAAVEVYSDLLGACRGLCGTSRGIVCILGTGSNSCLYNGRDIESNTPSLGYVLGDEGSGSALGKALVADCLKGLMPDHLSRELTDKYDCTTANVLEQVYKKPFANRYLASFAPFILQHSADPYIKNLVSVCFDKFIERNLLQYNEQDTPLYFVGSIAVYFAEVLKERCAAHGFTLAVTEKNPARGLAGFHLKDI